jgi:hypothetical protein
LGKMLRNGRVIWFATLVLATAIATYGFGWLAVPVCAAAWAWIRRTDAAVPLLAAVAGATAWIALLLLGIGTAEVARVADVAGAAMQVGSAALLVLTVTFPALVAGSVAGVVRGIAGTSA